MCHAKCHVGGKEEKERNKGGLLVSVHMHLCSCVHLHQWGEGTLRFVSIVKAPQVSWEHRHCLFHKRRPYLEYARHGAEVCVSSQPAFSRTDKKYKNAKVSSDCLQSLVLRLWGLLAL